jgi:hypothetical protein
MPKLKKEGMSREKSVKTVFESVVKIKIKS